MSNVEIEGGKDKEKKEETCLNKYGVRNHLKNLSKGVSLIGV
jgi:hypothetical protein